MNKHIYRTLMAVLIALFLTSGYKTICYFLDMKKGDEVDQTVNAIVMQPVEQENTEVTLEDEEEEEYVFYFD